MLISWLSYQIITNYHIGLNCTEGGKMRQNHKIGIDIHRPLLTSIRQESTKQKVPERPIPALQCITAGPTSDSSTPASRTAIRKLRNVTGELGTPKSGQVTYWKCDTSRLSLAWK